ncbi:helix-turn-helix domain-containing protein [Streptomyces turgidiscabies]|uniref:helix-turn-helix domain-containing protein n=1 Tax=Streptomyces turgidiscabies TaxID=85558 RepID=UPI0027D77A62|nr:helix-turn-helix transcriptional regulator [Streptomyces turgidiscabies]
MSNENTQNPPTMYAVHSSARLKTLMERTHTGESISSRELATKAGVAHGTIGGLMSGAQRIVPEDKAQAIVDALGVELLVLWVEMERQGRVFIPAQAAV